MIPIQSYKIPVIPRLAPQAVEIRNILAKKRIATTSLRTGFAMTGVFYLMQNFLHKKIQRQGQQGAAFLVRIIPCHQQQ